MNRIKDLIIFLLITTVLYLYFQPSVNGSDLIVEDDKQILNATEPEAGSNAFKQEKRDAKAAVKTVSIEGVPYSNEDFTHERKSLVNPPDETNSGNASDYEKTELEHQDELFHFLHQDERLAKIRIDNIKCSKETCTIDFYTPDNGSSVEYAIKVISNLKENKSWKDNAIYSNVQDQSFRIEIDNRKHLDK
ncbi:hypothetical protein [Pseudoalteromonas peptidolytica]|uniref:hypothetical protein n=1 Tax=Pseudoalteromonas peptidolytica TaxID=61150 RepID=UPI00298E1EA8|nr:hypothetical protein [Pseudoalteromonas peptidolytica]MDW7549122.1 hypothetical protein [Pseudoalteromonas peptidolytica]